MGKFRQLKDVAEALEGACYDLDKVTCTLELVMNTAYSRTAKGTEYIGDNLIPVIGLALSECTRVMKDMEQLQERVNGYAEEYRADEGASPPVKSGSGIFL